MLATVVDFDALWGAIWSAAISGILVSLIVALAVRSYARSHDLRLSGSSGPAAVHTGIALLAALASLGAAGFGIYLIVT